MEEERQLLLNSAPEEEEIANGAEMVQAVSLPITEIAPPKVDLHAPPPYEEISISFPIPEEISTSLPPTYEEVQRQKAIEAGEDPALLPNLTSDRSDPRNVMRFPTIGGMEVTGDMIDEQVLGTDMTFFIAFTATFIFNWVGFVLLLCFCHTIAGRTGALAGFGLSLAKWTVIVRHSMELVDDSNTWLLWIIMVLGLLVFARGILQYVNAKREFMKSPHGNRTQLVLF